MPQLNWSYFKPEFSSKPEENAEAHLLRTNDWMETHNFPEAAKVQRFCLTLTGEASLWYESLRLIEVDWTGLQECFRQQYSKFGNTRDQLFHVWRSFHYDENVEPIDAYVNRIKQMVVLLNYGEPQILELFKNILPSKLYWVLFSNNNLRDDVDAVKRVLTKEKIDKQPSGQSGTATPFMKVGDVPHSSKKVSFNAHDPIRERLESLTSMVYNMAIQNKKNNRPFEPQIYQKRGRGQNRNFGNQDRNRSFSRDRQDKTLDITTGDNCKTDAYNMDMTIREEVIDIKIIIIIEMTVEIEGDKPLGEALYSFSNYEQNQVV